MLASALTDWMQAVGTSVAALLAVGAAVAALLQLRSIKEQTMASASANVSQAYAVVSQQMGAIREHFLSHPQWYPYFYEGEEPKGYDADDAAQLEAARREAAQLEVVCEAICDFADGLVEQRRATPQADMDWSTWEAYFRFLYAESPLLRGYIRENIEYYPDYVLSIFGFVVVRDEQSGAVESMWAATALENEDDVRGAFGGALVDPVVVAGYPWIRTWEIREVRDDEHEPRELVASVQPAKDGGRTASLYLAWRGEDDRAATRVLRSWLVGLIAQSTSLAAVDVFAVEAGTKRRDGRVELRRESEARRAERFLVPELPLRR